MILANQLNWKLLLLEGIVFCILGLIAITHPFFVTWGINLVLGFILIIAGAVQGYRAFKGINDSSSIPLFIGAAVSLIIGIFFLVYPMTGMLTLTLFLTIYFLIDGITKIVSSWQLRYVKGWPWLLISGLISLLLTFLILSGLPSTADWILAIFLGVYLVFVGGALIALAIFVKRDSKKDITKAG
ncbi:MAG: DUF308 domain-containing protein [Waddliaceae bacterium]